MLEMEERDEWVYSFKHDRNMVTAWPSAPACAQRSKHSLKWTLNGMGLSCLFHCKDAALNQSQVGWWLFAAHGLGVKVLGKQWASLDWAT